MNGAVLLLLLVFESVGPNGWILSKQLTDDDLPQRLPTASFAERAADLWVIYHHHDDWASAFYVAPGRQIVSGPLAALLDEDALPRLLPGLAVPRLFLYAPFHLRDGASVSLESMALDVAEYYVNALTEAWLDLRCGAASHNAEGDAFCVLLDRRAHELWQSVPEDQRPDVHRGAWTDFSSHAFAVAAELHRSLARARALGRDPCPAVRHPNTLYGMWPKIFTEHSYPGRYQLRPEGTDGEVAGGRLGGGEWVMTNETLETSDKQMLMRYLYGDFWKGNVEEDFRPDCTDAAE